ncbi:MAG: twin-arginine translocase TatA/TatE family subunit [Pseudomonadota bacterium]
MGLGAPGLWQLIIIAVIVMLVFGTKKLKNIGEDLGAGIKGFKKAMDNGEPNDKDPDQLTRNDIGSTIDVKAEKVEDKR